MTDVAADTQLSPWSSWGHLESLWYDFLELDFSKTNTKEAGPPCLWCLVNNPIANLENVQEKKEKEQKRIHLQDVEANTN
jgi:hypothetical protein